MEGFCRRLYSGANWNRGLRILWRNSFIAMDCDLKKMGREERKLRASVQQAPLTLLLFQGLYLGLICLAFLRSQYFDMFY